MFRRGTEGRPMERLPLDLASICRPGKMYIRLTPSRSRTCRHHKECTLFGTSEMWCQQSRAGKQLMKWHPSPEHTSH